MLRAPSPTTPRLCPALDALLANRLPDVVILTADRAISRTEPANAPRWDWIHSVPRGYEDTAVATVLEQIARDPRAALRSRVTVPTSRKVVLALKTAKSMGL